jgi:vacuolar-type H+-ATPase subunit F/Vma7
VNRNQREIKTVNHFRFQKPIRAIFSGSSQSGKTFLIGKILENQKNMFGDYFAFVKYYYPTYLDESPVEYHMLTDTPVAYSAGFPTKGEILSLPENSLVVIDDQADVAMKSDLISQLFKVISGKKNLSVILVTQNYFMQGKHSRDIRNSCNYAALFRNCCDHLLNKRVATAFGLKLAYEAAEKDTYTKDVYPYVFIDQTQRAQLSSYRLYTDILGDYKVAYSSTGMKGYILSEDDFLSAFRILSENKLSVIAVNKNEDTKRAIQKSAKRESRKEKGVTSVKKKSRRENRHYEDA